MVDVRKTLRETLSEKKLFEWHKRLLSSHKRVARFISWFNKDEIPRPFSLVAQINLDHFTIEDKMVE